MTDTHAGRTRRGGRRGPHTPKRRLPLDTDWQMCTDELLSRIANLPSRAGMKRPKPKRDLAENLDRAYQWAWRRARAQQNAAIDTAWAQVAVGCGYEGNLNDPDDRARLAAIGSWSCKNYLDLLQEAGLLVYGGIKDANGAWERLSIVLLEPPVWEHGAPAPVAQLDVATRLVWLAEAERIRETKREICERRRQPYRRKGGRADAVQRHRIFWSRSNRSSPSCFPSSSRRGNDQGRACAHTREAVEDPSETRGSAPTLDEPGAQARRSATPGPGEQAGRTAQAATGEVAPGPSGRGSAPWQRPSLAAISALVDRAARGERLETLRQAVDAGEDGVAVAEAAWRLLTGRSPKLSAKRAEQLHNALGVLDRCANFGAGQRGAGGRLVLEQLEAVLDDAAAGYLPAVHSLAFVVCEVRRIARQWRRAAKGRPPVRDTGQRDRERAAARAERERLALRAAAYRREQVYNRRGKRGRS